jgi:hypothetical protein
VWKIGQLSEFFDYTLWFVRPQIPARKACYEPCKRFTRVYVSQKRTYLNPLEVNSSVIRIRIKELQRAIIKIAEEFCLPLIPNARSNSCNICHCQYGEESQNFRRTNFTGKCENEGVIINVSSEREFRHEEMPQYKKLKDF